MLKERISRFSLGVVCDELYDPMKSVNQDVYTGPIDGKRYVRGAVVWFVKKVRLPVILKTSD